MEEGHKSAKKIPSFDLIAESDDDQADGHYLMKTAQTPEFIRINRAEIQPEKNVSINLSFDITQGDSKLSRHSNSNRLAVGSFSNRKKSTEEKMSANRNQSYAANAQIDKSAISDRSEDLAFLPDNLQEALMPFQREAIDRLLCTHLLISK